MRYIGSKAALLDKIEYVINENTTGKERIFCDLFSGTGAVARYFKPRYEMHSNDLLHFSYVIQKATIENNERPSFAKLKKIGIFDPFSFLEENKLPQGNSQKLFISDNYSPNDHCSRMYVSNKNAERIDYIRITIESWKKAGLLDDNEYYYLLAGLIEGVPFVSNITGTYGAYLKHWDKRAYNELELMRLDVVDNKRNNRCYNMDANQLIKDLEGDILYLDPPYNSRQYAPNYHLLETISRYDYPDIKGVTGVRNYDNQKSAYCTKKEVCSAFEDLIENARFNNIVLSYSSDGLMTFDQIETIMKRHGKKGSFKRYDIPYRKYKSKHEQKEKVLYEYLFYVSKNMKNKKNYPISDNPLGYSASKRKSGVLQNKKYLKSPLNYIGGKYKLLPQIIPELPNDINTFVDLFSGGANVAINVDADKIICNDINFKIIEMFNYFKDNTLDDILEQIYANIEEFGLSKVNKEGFVEFRNHYNMNPNPIDLYTLSCYSFNYQFRFNNKHQYNNPFGRNRSHFSDRMKSNLIKFVNKLAESNITFQSMDFVDVDFSGLGPQDMVYCDPPYLITTGTYNDGNRGFKDWSLKEEKQLYDLLDELNDKNIRFALSNVLKHKGHVNETLLEWSKKYKVIHLNYNYTNSSYNTRRGDSDEVLITNY